MQLIDSSIELIDADDQDRIIHKLERIGRVAYKSEDNMTDESAVPFLQRLIKRGHESVLEHCIITVLITTDRATANALVRHRIAAYTQESTIYCNYGKRGGLKVRAPFFLDRQPKAVDIWLKAMNSAETAYLQLLEIGLSPGEARDVLPLATKTELIATYDLRIWRHVLRLRADPSDSWGIHLVMGQVLNKFQEKYPVLFSDIAFGKAYSIAHDRNEEWVYGNEGYGE